MSHNPPGGSSLGADSVDLDDLLDSLGLVGKQVVGASWSPSLGDFRIDLDDGSALICRGCLQAGFHRSLASAGPYTVEGWWTDEPSPLLATLGAEVRFRFQHLVFDLGEGLLRVACRSVELSPALRAGSPRSGPNGRD